MNKLLISSLLVGLMSITASAYDTEKAKSLDKFYSNFTQKACANSKLFIKADEVMKMLRDETKMTVLDIRTEGEHAVLALGLKNSLFIPIKDLFKKENLEKLPSDEPIYILCYSGSRALLAAAGLKQIGIKNVRVIEGGIVDLAKADNTLNAPLR